MPFVSIARTLTGLDLSAPSVIAWDREDGFVLLEDLGDDTFTKMLAQGGDEATLYAHAVETLVALHRRCSAASLNGLPGYSDDLFLTESSLLTEWYLPAVTGRDTPAAGADAFRTAWTSVLPQARQVPDTLVLRDYHVDNLMWLPDRDGAQTVGLLDFQDAVVGPITYDLASLLTDARRDVDQAMADRLIDRYLELFPALDPEALRASYAIMAAQRAAKIIGLFIRLDRRDGKPRYLGHIARLWRLMDVLLRHPALTPVAAWMETHVPPEIRITPEAQSQ